MCTSHPISPNNTHSWVTTFDHTQETGAMRQTCTECGVILWKYNGIMTISWKPGEAHLARIEAAEYIAASSAATDTAKALAFAWPNDIHASPALRGY